MTRSKTQLWALSRVIAIFLTSLLALAGLVSAQTHVTVTANPLWTDTGIDVGDGDQVFITASGTWGYLSAQSGGPDGDPTWPDPTDQFFLGANKGELIAYVGSDPTQGHLVPGNTFFPQSTGYFAIGSVASFISPTSGKLWLGINDDARSLVSGDNHGSLSAVITKSHPPITLSILVNQAVFGVAQTLSATVGLTNPGGAATIDLYLGVLVPGGTIVFFTGSGGVTVGNVADFTSFRPIAAGLSLAKPFAVTVPNFFSHQWTGNEPRGRYLLFFGAVQAGALATGTLSSDAILGLVIAPFSFP